MDFSRGPGQKLFLQGIPIALYIALLLYMKKGPLALLRCVSIIPIMLMMLLMIPWLTAVPPLALMPTAWTSPLADLANTALALSRSWL